MISRRRNGKRTPVITGIGVIAPNGIGKDSFWRACLDGASGIDYIKDFDTSPLKTRIAGIIKDFKPEAFFDENQIEKLDRFCQLGVAAAEESVKDSSLNISSLNADRIGVYAGSGLGGILFHEDQIVKVLAARIKKIGPLSLIKTMPNSLSSQISLQLKTFGPALTISSACSSGLQAIGLASELMRIGKADLMITGGAEAPLTAFTFAAFDSMRVMTQRNDPPNEASCPFDRRRDGFVLSEAAAFLAVETLESALRRNVKIYAEILGFSNTSSAYHMVIQQPDGKDIEKTISLALKDAGLSPYDIGYINAHGTSTKSNDKIETKAIKNVFGSHAKKLLISSTKSMIGHPIGAAGAIGAAVSAMSLNTGLITPTINYKEPDSECDLNYVPNKAVKKSVDYALINSFGFGGTNCSLVLGKFKA